MAICFAQSVNLMAITNGNRVQWSPADLLSNAFVDNPVATPAQTTSFIVAVYGNEGCPKASFDTIVVKVEPPIMMQGVRDTTIVIGQPLQMNVTGAPSFSWIPNVNISNASIGNPVILFNQATEGIKYKVIGFNSAGCLDSLEFTIKVFSTLPTVFVPTAFTPNGDGLNETLKPTLAGMQQFDYFRIFNRFGQLVFETREINQGWDGYLKGQKQPSGTFVWMLQAVDFEGKMVQAKGSTMLIR
jgi:gliding motility-associated-like protein